MSDKVKEAIAYFKENNPSAFEDTRKQEHVCHLHTLITAAEQLEANAEHIGDLLDVNEENAKLKSRIAELEAALKWRNDVEAKEWGEK